MLLCRLPMLLLVVGSTIVTHFSGVSLKPVSIDYSQSKIVLLELSQISCRYTHITPVLRKLHWLPIQFRSEFKLATLVYKFIHTGFPKYFAPHLSTYRTTYNTRRSQSVANFLNVPKFQPTIHKSTKQFGFSFAFDAPTVWNSLPEDIRASPTLASFRKKLKTYLYAKAYPP